MVRRVLSPCVLVMGGMVTGAIITSTIIFQFLWCSSSLTDQPRPLALHALKGRSSLAYSNTQEKCVCGGELQSLLNKARNEGREGGREGGRGGGRGGGGGVGLKTEQSVDIVRYRTISLPCVNETPSLDYQDNLLVSIAAGEGAPTWPEAVYETWGRDSSNILFFVGSSFNFNRSNSSGLPLVRVESLQYPSPSYPTPSPSHVSTLSILHHVMGRYLDTYQWFLLALENSYVRVDKLKSYLSQLNPEDQIYLGRSASGKQGEEERLGLRPHERYCLGNSGVVLSRGLLLSLRGQLEGCVESERESVPGDVVLGKCISRTLDIQCTQSSQIRSYFFEDYSGRHYLDHNVLGSHSDVFFSLMSYHPVPSPQDMYFLHHTYKKREFKSHLNKVEAIKRQLVEICDVHDFFPNCVPSICEQGEKCSNSGEVTRLRTPYRPNTIYDYQPWQYFDVNSLYHDQMTQPSYRMKIKKNYKSELQHAMTKAVQKSSERFGKTLKLRQLVNGWVRHNPFLGNEYIFDLFMTSGSNKKLTTRVSMVQPLATNYLVVKDTADTSVFINMVVPVTKVNQRFVEFMEMYESLVLKTKEHVRLFLPVYGEGDVEFVNKVLSKYIHAYPWANMTVLPGKGEFSRGKALHYGITHLKEQDLIFICDVDMVVTLPFFDRCRRNTVQRSRVYYPEFFKLYNLDYVYWNKPRPSKVSLKREHGHWAYYSFGMLCIYKSDYDSVGGMDTNIAGWGDEDVHFFQKVIRKRLEVLRAPDTGLSHRWHDKSCPKSLTPKQHKHCLSSQQENLADRKELARYIYDLGVNIKGKGKGGVASSPVLTSNMTASEEEEQDYNF